MQLGATLCPVCKSQRSPWRNQLVFFAGTAGFLTLIATALSFAARQVALVYRQVAWTDDVKVLQLGISMPPFIYVALSNSGDGDVLAKSISIRWNEGVYQYALDRVIKPGTVEVFDRQTGDDEEIFKKWKVRPFGYISNETGAATSFHLKNAQLKTDVDTPACLLTKIYDANNTSVKMMQAHYESQNTKLVLGQAVATASFFSIRTGNILEKPFPVVATFLRWNLLACKE